MAKGRRIGGKKSHKNHNFPSLAPTLMVFGARDVICGR
jgi:hypothetical protein